MKTKSILLVLIIIFFQQIAFSATSATQNITATLGGGGGGGGGGGNNIGGIIAGGSIGSVASGASALAFAPVLLAGLEPNGVVCAAAPLECICPRNNYLEQAIKIYCGCKKLTNDECTCPKRIYFAQNDCAIINGTYDIDEVKLSDELKSANKIKVNITIVSQPYNEIRGEPELSIGIYKDISSKCLGKKFETQQFLHNYLMSKYKIPLKITCKDYHNGIQKLSGIIDTRKIKYINQPLQVVMTYTEGGFRRNLKKQNPKILIYAYLIEFAK